jgi:hypothetical protein
LRKLLAGRERRRKIIDDLKASAFGAIRAAQGGAMNTDVDPAPRRAESTLIRRPIPVIARKGTGGSVETWNAAHEVWAIYLRLFARRVWDRVNKEAA